MAAAHRRLANVAAVHVRNLEVDEEVDAASIHGARRASTSFSAYTPSVRSAHMMKEHDSVVSCFVSLRRPGGVPFYVTPPSAAGRHASWGEYTSPPIRPADDFAAWAWPADEPTLLVGLYARNHGSRPEPWQCLWETEVDLHTLPSRGGQLGAIGDARDNVVYLGLHSTDDDGQLEYVAVDGLATHEPDVEEAGRRAMLLSMVETQMKRSYTLPQACSLVHIQGDLASLQQTQHALAARCGGALSDDTALCRKRRQLETRHAAKDLRRTLQRRKDELSEAHTALVQTRLALQQRREHLAHGSTLLRETQARRTAAASSAAEQRYRMIQQHRTRLMRELEFIYPIQLEDARALLYSIAGLALPNGVATTHPKSGALVHKTHLEDTASALALVAQIVLLASTYLHTSLHYSLRAIGSRAVVQDGISVMSGPRTFALYGKGTEPYRYEYGVFLLNKDIEQLMMAHGVPVLDLRNTLPNVKNLLPRRVLTRFFMVLVCRPRETGDAHVRAAGTLEFADAYRHISRVSRQRVLGDPGTAAPGGATVLILTTPLVDSLAAARIFTRLLADDEIAFRVAPVNGYRALQQILAEDVEGHLEVGSLMPLPTSVPLPPNCTLHVLDSHRPWNLSNLFATSQINDHIYIWDDGEVEERLGREREAYEMLEFDVDSDSEEEDSESEGEASDDAQSDTPAADRPAKRARTPGGESHTKRRLDGEQRNVYRAVLAKYYSRGSWTGMSAAQMMYLLAVSLGRGDRDCLWYAVLGLTSQYISNAIHAGTYEGYASALASDVVAMSADDPRPAEIRGLRDVNMHGADDSAVRVVPDELRFTLYRHWSLETSMYHTSYVAAKLGIWREKGISKLRGLLAKMGLSLANCRQTYEHMDLDLRNSLVSRMESIAPEYGLTDLVFQSFTRSYGFRSMPLSASDAVEGISALLQAAHGVRVEVEGVQIVRTDSVASTRSVDNAADRGASSYGGRTLWSLSDTGVHVGARGIDEADNDPADDRDSADWENTASATWVQNFFEAYRAMDVQKASSIHLLQKSLTLAKALHQAIVAQGVTIIVKQSIKTLRSFRLSVLQDGPQLNLFVHPDTLTRLGFWLIDALRDIVSEQAERRAAAKRSKRRSKDDAGQSEQHTLQSLPFVLAALDKARDVYIVVGIVGAPDYGDVGRNRFGLAFQEAAASSGARMRNDRFDSSVLEVKRDDLLAFVEALHLQA